MRTLKQALAAIIVAVAVIAPTHVAHASSGCAGTMCASTYCYNRDSDGKCRGIQISDRASGLRTFKSGSAVYFYRYGTYIGGVSCAGKHYCDFIKSVTATSQSGLSARHVLNDGLNQMDRTFQAT